MNRTELLSYMRSHKLVVIGTSGAGSPQGALVGIGVADDLQVIFDTVSDNLQIIGRLFSIRFQIRENTKTCNAIHASR
jgi:hypothetical protein